MVLTALKPIIAADIRHSSPIRSLKAWNGDWLASGDIDGRLVVTHGESVVVDRCFEVAGHLGARSDSVNKITLSAEMDRLFFIKGTTIYALDLASGEIAWTYSTRRVFAFLRSVPQDFVLLADGVLAVSSSSGHMYWLSQDGEKLDEVFDHDAPSSMVLVNGGNEIVGCDGFSTHIWCTKTRRRLRSHVYSERCYGIMPLGSGRGYAMRTEKGIELFSEQHDALGVVHVLPGPPKIAYDSQDGILVTLAELSLSLWNRNGDVIGTVHLDGTRPTSLSYDESNRELLVGAADGSIYKESLTQLVAIAKG